MKEKLRNMYEEGLLDTTGLLNAVAKDWITITDVVEIVGEDNALSVVMSAKLSEISSPEYSSPVRKHASVILGVIKSAQAASFFIRRCISLV